MPTFMNGDMWQIFPLTDWFLITTNPIVNSKGEIVMGRGIAKQAALRYPSMPRDFAKVLATRPYNEHNVGTIGTYDSIRVGFFMVKNHWADKANPIIIRESVAQLNDILQTLERAYGHVIRVDLNYPGIGNGRLTKEQVAPLLEPLPSNVHIWEYDNES